MVTHGVGVTGRRDWASLAAVIVNQAMMITCLVAVMVTWAPPVTPTPASVFRAMSQRSSRPLVPAP